MASINDVMKKYFDQLGIDPIDFTFNEKTNKYITTESFQYDENDPEAYFIVVQMVNSIGNIFIGTSDGIKFIKHEMLGQIMNLNGNWINL